MTEKPKLSGSLGKMMRLFESEKDMVIRTVMRKVIIIESDNRNRPAPLKKIREVIDGEARLKEIANQ